jgi:hypothetical protein
LKVGRTCRFSGAAGFQRAGAVCAAAAPAMFNMMNAAQAARIPILRT